MRHTKKFHSSITKPVKSSKPKPKKPKDSFKKLESMFKATEEFSCENCPSQFRQIGQVWGAYCNHGCNFT